MVSTLIRLSLAALAILMAVQPAFSAPDAPPAAAPAPAATPADAPAQVVDVVFVHPERYTDDGDRYASASERPAEVMDTIRAHLQKVGQACLPKGQHVQIQVLDIRLAGDVEWWHHARGGYPYDFRVMRDYNWPSMNMEYTWTGTDGTVLREGKDKVSDPVYLQHAAFGGHDSGALPYEKYMLTRWFQQQFCTVPKGGQPERSH